MKAFPVIVGSGLEDVKNKNKSILQLVAGQLKVAIVNQLNPRKVGMVGRKVLRPIEFI